MTLVGMTVESLTVAESDRLDHEESTIEWGLKTFVETGTALAVIRDERLYRQTHGTFEAYCEQRWNLSRPRAYQLIEAANIRETLSTNVDTPLPVTESQARELSGLEPEQAAEVMTKAHEDTDGNLTAAAIREAREETTAAAFIEKYPPLAHYSDDPKRVIATGTQLDTFSATELPSRLDNLAKHIAADKARSSEPPKPETPNYYAMTGAMFDAANTLCRVFDAEGGAGTLTAALADADAFTVHLWADQFASAITKLETLAEACRPTLRSVT